VINLQKTKKISEMKMKICNICISSSENEICDICLNHKQAVQKVLGEETLFSELEKYRGKSEYDCAVAFSGGKDSSYVLYRLKEKYKLRILAITGEDYISSKQAWKNRFQVTQKLGVRVPSIWCII
jgi:predicted PP-loop superfamily ATPase